jgi:hypothetical protein
MLLKRLDKMLGICTYKQPIPRLRVLLILFREKKSLLESHMGHLVLQSLTPDAYQFP